MKLRSIVLAGLLGSTLLMMSGCGSDDVKDLVNKLAKPKRIKSACFVSLIFEWRKKLFAQYTSTPIIRQSILSGSVLNEFNTNLKTELNEKPTPFARLKYFLT